MKFQMRFGVPILFKGVITMRSKTYLRIGGSIALFYAVFHIFMPLIVPQLYSAPLVNGLAIGVMNVFNLLTALVCLGIAVIAFIFSAELVSSRFGRVVCGYFAAIGLFRALLEVIFVGITKPASIFIIATTFTAGLCCILAMRKHNPE
jgi:hypothetical protein